MNSISSLLSDASEDDKRKCHQLHTAVCAWVSVIACARSFLPRRMFGVVYTSKEDEFFRGSFQIENTRKKNSLFEQESNAHGMEQTCNESSSSSSLANEQGKKKRVPEQRLLMLRKPCLESGPMVLHIGLAHCFSAVIVELIKMCRAYLATPSGRLGEDHSSIIVTIEDEDGRMHEAYVLDVYLHVPDNPESDSDGSEHLRTHGFAAGRYDELGLLCNTLQSLCYFLPPLQPRSQIRVHFHQTMHSNYSDQAEANQHSVPDYSHMPTRHKRTIIVSQWRLVSYVYSLSSAEKLDTDAV